MKIYGEIALNETSIIVLGCSYFFTAENLDSLVGMHGMYESNTDNEFVGLQNVSAELARSIPKFTDCNCLIC
jgi:hypothetical protein